MDWRNIQGVVSNEDMNEPSFPKTERGAQGKRGNVHSCYGTSARGAGMALGRRQQEASSQAPLFQFQRPIM